jgi:hypothetical protein
MNRTELNRKIRAIAHGVLHLDEESYRQVVLNVDFNSQGHITRCDIEHANLVLLVLRRMVEKRKIRRDSTSFPSNFRQHKFIARLMQYLGWTWKDTAAFCLRQTGKRSTKACTAAELSKVILGLIGIINGKIEKGEITLSEAEMFAYRKHTKQLTPEDSF